jgi:hypothetical protein
MGKVKGKKKHGGTIIIILINVVAVLFLFMIILPLNRSANEIGEGTGLMAGKLVGATVGSLDGITKYNNALEDGKKEGLSAKDTQVEMQNTMSEVNNLEVLVANVKISNYHEISDKYSALYLLKAEAIFTVDLSGCIIDVGDDNMIVITVPQPKVEVNIDENAIDKAVELQKKLFNGSAEDGFDAYINSMANLEEETLQGLRNDSNMMENARKSAEEQISELASGICVNGEKVNILWEEG